MAFLGLIQNLFYLFLGIFGVGFVIAFHEFGHFIFAKWFNVKVPSFSIGMGPSILQAKWGHTVFKLSALPLGGYVEIVDKPDPDEDDKEAQAKMAIPGKYFGEISYWKKLCIMTGGIFCNFLLGYLFFTFLFFVGMPKLPLINPNYTSPNEIAMLMPGSVGQQAGLEPGDKIVAGNNSEHFSTANEVTAFLRNHPNEKITLTVERNDKKLDIPVELNKKGQIGAMFKMESEPRQSIGSSIVYGFSETWKCFVQTAGMFKSIVKGKSRGDVAGPIMIIAQMIMGAKLGYKVFLILLAFISINLAFLNMIPVPITDGGQILFHTIEAIIRRPLPDSVRTVIHYISWILVLGLFIILSLKDIMSLIGINLKSLF